MDLLDSDLWIYGIFGLTGWFAVLWDFFAVCFFMDRLFRSHFSALEVSTVQQCIYRNMTTVLTREYLDARPDGWLDYAAKRIAQPGAEKCYNRSLCEEHLNLILLGKPPFRPRQFRTCAVVGNSGDLLKTVWKRN